MKRLLLFSHYNKYGLLSEHVIYLLKNLQKYYDATVFISNSSLSSADEKRLEGLQQKIITRKNEGYDFAAWRDGMSELGWSKLKKYDSVTIMNDTCFGPVFSFDNIFKTMEKQKIDFWGMVTHRQISAHDSPNGIEIPEHLQSFFISFNKNVVASDVFKNFWIGIADHSDVNEVINNYETKLTKILQSTGFNYSSFFDTSVVDMKVTKSIASNANFTIYSPEICIDYKVPLVKIKAFTHHSYPRYLVDKVANDTKFPIKIVQDYFNEYFDPNQQLLMFNKIVDEDLNTSHINKKQKIAVHLHAFYMDVAEEFIQKFNNWQFDFDLFITVSNNDLKKQITTILSKYNIKARKILILPNRGYAVIPWMTVATKYMSKYDVVGHFHTKKDAHMDEWVGKVWTGDLVRMLVEPAEDIMKNFAENDSLGVVVPDIPRHARYLGAEMYYNLPHLRNIIESVYSRFNLNTNRIVDFDKILAFIYPYGMMYWYRPEALRPITELVFDENEVPFGKLPDTTVLHAIERLFVYVAWGQGYDYRISKLKDYTSEFITTIAVNQQAYDKERNTQLLTIGIKGAVKDKSKRELKRVADKLPVSVKLRLLNVLSRARSGGTINHRPPTIKLFSHELSNTGGPRVALDLLKQMKSSDEINKFNTPELYVPEGARTDADLKKDLIEQNIKINSFRPENLIFSKGDIVIINTIAYTEAVFSVVLSNVARGTIRHLFIYPHEFVVDSYMSPQMTAKVSKLMKQNKITMYASAKKAQEVYIKHFKENKIGLMPNRIDINKESIFSRDKNDFNNIRFVITGTPDARKGELDVLYAFTSFYNRYYKNNKKQYRDFTLTIVGLTNNFRDVYNKLYSDRLREAAKGLDGRVILFEQQPEKESLEIIKKSNFTVLYSLYENLPRVVFDGLAYGHPILRNDCSGSEEQLLEGVNGWKASTEDWEGLVSSIEEILSIEKTTNAKLANMSKESAKIAMKYANLSYRVIDDIKDLIEQDSSDT